jgi:NAD(P)H-dependent flavin oxidoreductase YrpB (nitropropane dioxygenase family)
MEVQPISSNLVQKAYLHTKTVKSESKGNTSMRTELCDRLGIDVPIFAFSHCRNVVVEASKTGAMGVLGAVGFMPEDWARELDALDREVQGKPYGIDVVMPATSPFGDERDPHELMARLRSQIPPENIAFVKKILAENGVPELPEGEQHEGETLLRSTAATARMHVDIGLTHDLVKLVVSALGPLPADLVETIHGSGRLIAGMSGSAANARKHVEGGADIVIAQGAEGGGHASAVGSMVLWPEVIEAVHPVPVLAAGGVGSGAQIAAALLFGAQGVWTGSIWLTTVDSELTDPQREALVEAGSRDTVLSKSVTGKNVRMLRNKWTEAWASPEAPATLPLPLQDLVSNECYSRARAYPQQGKDISILPVGQIVGKMNHVDRTRDVIYRLAEEYMATTERFKGLLEQQS